jgi:hypothetical protein
LAPAKSGNTTYSVGNRPNIRTHRIPKRISKDVENEKHKTKSIKQKKLWFDSFPFHLCTDTHLKCRSSVLNWRVHCGRPRQSTPDSARRYAPDVIWRRLAHSSSPPCPRSINCCALPFPLPCTLIVRLLHEYIRLLTIS